MQNEEYAIENQDNHLNFQKSKFLPLIWILHPKKRPENELQKFRVILYAWTGWKSVKIT